LKQRSKRIVYSPASKIIAAEPEVLPPDLDVLLKERFTASVLTDRYYHPFFSHTTPYVIDAHQTGTLNKSVKMEKVKKWSAVTYAQ
jgi:hypothetical protein